MYTAQSLTKELLTEMFGDRYDWAYVYKNNLRIGTFAELRKRVLDSQAKKNKPKIKTDPSELFEFLQRRFPGNNVFMNKTQPNIHINGCKCYFIAGNGSRCSLGIVHHTHTYETLLAEAAIYKARPNKANDHHILFAGLTYSQAEDLIKNLCKE